MSCLGFGVYLVNGDLSKYIQLFIPISWETFLCFSSCVVARRHLCHVALAAPWLKPLASSIGLLSPTRGSSLVPQHASPSFFKWPPPSAPRLAGCRKGGLLRWASDYFLSGERDNDLWVWESSTHALPAEIGSLTNGSSSSVAAILLHSYTTISTAVLLCGSAAVHDSNLRPCLIVLMLLGARA